MKSFISLAITLGLTQTAVATQLDSSLEQRAGKEVYCSSTEAIEQDYVSQLKRHRLYGDIEVIRSESPAQAKIAEQYAAYVQNRQTISRGENSVNFPSNTFANVTADQIFDGSKVFQADSKVKLEVGDILLNMNFYTKEKEGRFYSKRSMIHAKLVVAVGEDSFTTHDGGWQGWRTYHELHSQTVVLRPTLSEEEIAKLISMAEKFEPLPYDKTLNDEIGTFKRNLNQSLDDRLINGESLAEAGSNAVAQAMRHQNSAPYGDLDVWDVEGDSVSHYCSEAASQIFAFLGYRQFGETGYDMIKAFAIDGQIPEWTHYLDALKGFSADTGATKTVHQLMHAYLTLLKASWEQGLIEIKDSDGKVYVPGEDNFILAAKASRDYAMQTTAESRTDDVEGEIDYMAVQMETAAAIVDSKLDQLRRMPEVAQPLEIIAGLEQLQQGFKGFNDAVGQVMQASGAPSFTEFINGQFYTNEFFGPHSYFENAKYFKLVGVSYNSSRSRSYSPQWVPADKNTTDYIIDPDRAPEGGGCQAAE